MKQTQTKDVYQMVTDKVIESLKNGVAPWQKPWAACGGFIRRSNGQPYSFLNQMLLACQGGINGEYMSLNECNRLGGHIRKGAKGKLVTFFHMVGGGTQVVKNDETGEMETVIKASYPCLKHYYVYHISDCEGVEAKYKSEYVRPGEGLTPVDSAELVIKGYNDREKTLRIERNDVSDSACYCPSTDLVRVPCLEQFKDVNEFYSTMFHELTHSTGIDSRCKRGLGSVAAFGSSTYAKEELVAEMGSAMCINRLGLDADKAFDNSVAYLQGWLKALSDDKRLIVSAASKAEAAVKYIFGDEAK